VKLGIAVIWVQFLVRSRGHFHYVRGVKIKFQGSMIEWPGPSPFYFVPAPHGPSKKIKEMADELSYGWGVIPVLAQIGNTAFSTALIPKDGLYYLPIKNAVRFAQELKVGSKVVVLITFGS
jgi:hypothetical protein